MRRVPPARSKEYGRLETLLAEVGIAMPPLPDGAEARLKEREDACFSTRAFKESPLDLQHYVRKAIAGASPDYVLIARVPQGASSCVLHYFVVQGPLQVFLQLACGSAAGRDRSTTSANECFRLAHELVAAVPRALGAGRLSRSGRLTVVGSDLVESFWEIAAAGEHASQPGRPSRGKTRDVRRPRQILEEAVRWCRGGGPLA
jgi:hypothetical protein